MVCGIPEGNGRNSNLEVSEEVRRGPVGPGRPGRLVGEIDRRDGTTDETLGRDKDSSASCVSENHLSEVPDQDGQLILGSHKTCPPLEGLCYTSTQIRILVLSDHPVYVFLC